ncbi:hypothetical protein R3P38DRAFT_2812166 [Favolaschia claudopus]|uniref:Uncharacterized protein n=1 Tax=Favolaschia claudopus TaxID=2862362 RepID=A0AAV9Z8A1_9AGAR
MNDAPNKGKNTSKKPSATSRKRKERDPDRDDLSDNWGGKREGAGRPPKIPKIQVLPKSATTRKPAPTKLKSAPARVSVPGSSPRVPAFFRPYNTQRSAPLNGTVKQSFYSTIVSTAALEQLNSDLEFISENDEHADIAAGDKIIDESLVANTAEDESPEIETRKSETVRDSVLDTYLRSGVGLNADSLYQRKVFIWMPHLLPGSPDSFKCHCGNILVRNGYNDDPIARRVRSPASNFFLLTNRWICNPRRGIPGCGTSFQGSDPHIISQLPAFVQAAFPAYISPRGAVSTFMMSQMVNTFSTRLGPSPFAEMCSELQYKDHAVQEFMYLSAAKFYGQTGLKSFSSFDDRTGYAGSVPSVSYLKALFADYISAHRIYIERDTAARPLTIAKADHTFDFLKHMGGLKGERIFTAAYTVLNEFEEVCAHSLTLTKSLAFVEDMFKAIFEGLKKANHPPTQIIYTDSPQSEHTFHESINSSLTHNVERITDWTDLPSFERTAEVYTHFCVDTIAVEQTASDILQDFMLHTAPTELYSLAVSIKTSAEPGQIPRLISYSSEPRTKLSLLKYANSFP